MKIFESADLSKMLNFTYKDILNNIMINNDGIKFGKNETISSVIGKNQLAGSLSPLGNLINLILNMFEKDHAIKSIKKNE